MRFLARRRARASPGEELRLGFVIIRMGVDEYGEPLSNTHSHTDEMISDDTCLRVLCPRPRVESDATTARVPERAEERSIQHEHSIYFHLLTGQLMHPSL